MQRAQHVLAPAHAQQCCTAAGLSVSASAGGRAERGRAGERRMHRAGQHAVDRRAALAYSRRIGSLDASLKAQSLALLSPCSPPPPHRKRAPEMRERDGQAIQQVVDHVVQRISIWWEELLEQRMAYACERRGVGFLGVCGPGAPTPRGGAPDCELLASDRPTSHITLLMLIIYSMFHVARCLCARPPRLEGTPPPSPQVGTMPPLPTHQGWLQTPPGLCRTLTVCASLCCDCPHAGHEARPSVVKGCSCSRPRLSPAPAPSCILYSD